MNSPSSIQVSLFGYSASPRQWNESAVISVKVHRVFVPSGRVPSWRMSRPFQRPTCSSRCPLTGLVQAMRQASIDASHDLQRGAVHVHASIGVTAAVLGARHDPDVLDGAAFEDAARMNLALQSARRDVDAAIPQDFEVPAAAQPSVNVSRFRDLRRPCRRRQERVKIGRLIRCPAIFLLP